MEHRVVSLILCILVANLFAWTITFPPLVAFAIRTRCEGHYSVTGDVVWRDRAAHAEEHAWAWSKHRPAVMLATNALLAAIILVEKA